MSVHRPPVKTLAPLHVRTLEPGAGRIVVVVTGEVDMATAPALQSALLYAITALAPLVIDVDLSACTFLDCSGLGVLVAARGRALAARCELWITRPGPFMRVVLDRASLLDVFTAPEPTAPITEPATDPTPAACTPVGRVGRR